MCEHRPLSYLRDCENISAEGMSAVLVSGFQPKLLRALGGGINAQTRLTSRVCALSDGEELMSIPGFTAETVVDERQDADGSRGGTRARHRISVPGLTSEEVGLGDVIARIASVVGVSPCDGCRRRAHALNSWVSFSPRR
jgi:hypothetical protein